ncbi:MAG: hypothetical protein HYV27_17575 [Candidatus Hydrogenedentes bacterium]|nr:hypothetical protein [Candidatus Hydrogenedentota bacterium]
MPDVEDVEQLQAVFGEADTDDDGLLSLGEVQADLPGITESQFVMLDLNTDGGLSTEELQQFIDENAPLPPSCCASTKGYIRQSFTDLLGDLLLMALALGSLLALSRMRRIP